MFEGFSPRAVWELVCSGHVGCVVTTHHNHHHLRPLLQDNPLLAGLVLDSQNIKVETDLHSAEISPIFAIVEYTHHCLQNAQIYFKILVSISYLI